MVTDSSSWLTEASRDQQKPYKKYVLHCMSFPFTSCFLVAHSVKSLPVMQDTRVQSLSWEDPLRRDWHPTPVFLPGESHGQRSLAGYSPQGCKESEMTEWLNTLCLLQPSQLPFPSEKHSPSLAMQTLAIDADPNYNSLLISNKLIFAGEISVELFISGLQNINIQLALEQLK